MLSVDLGLNFFSHAHDMPNWLFGIICVGAFIGLTLIGLYITHKNVHRRLVLTETLIDNGVVGWFFSAMLVLYGITVGLIAVATWEGSSSVAGLASKEAASLAGLYRDVSGYPSPLKEKAQGDLRVYTKYIIEQAWPAQKRGEIPDGGTNLIDSLQGHMYAYEPATNGQNAIQAEALHAFNQVIELRRERLEAIDNGVPAILWAVVLIGGFFAIVFSFSFQLKSFRLHAVLSSGLAAMIGLLVFMIASLDRPFQGKISVSSTPYELIYNTLMKK